MTGIEAGLAGLAIAFVGFQIGSYVEYKKKYNFFDTEIDFYHEAEQFVKDELTKISNAGKDIAKDAEKVV